MQASSTHGAYPHAALRPCHAVLQILDHYFGNVCELDLVFGFHKVYCILDEFIIGGEIQETSKKARGCWACRVVGAGTDARTQGRHGCPVGRRCPPARLRAPCRSSWSG